jgi:hypothetical protein
MRGCESIHGSGVTAVLQHAAAVRHPCVKGGDAIVAVRLRTPGPARVPLIVALAALAFTGAAGCTSVPVEESVGVRLLLDSESYMIGQPVMATLVVTNDSESELLIPAMDESTLRFRWGRIGSNEVLARKPVLPQGWPALARVVEPHKSAARTFLFTRITAEPGEWGLIAGVYECRVGNETATSLPALYCPAATFTVSEEVMYRRDPYSGVITEEQAIELAGREAGLEVTEGARALLLPIDESGLHRWIVLFGGDDAPLQNGAAFEVNPYSGRVKPLDLEDSSDGGETL